MTAGLKTALADRYLIEREIGRGGMATVYLAEDLKHQRVVALKALHPELAVALGPRRFHREITIAAQLQHPNILPLLDSGNAPGGFLWFAMPYVDGESLGTASSASATSRCRSPSRSRATSPPRSTTHTNAG